VGDSEAQHIQDIVESSKGDYKYDPLLVVDAQKKISGDARLLERSIQFQLQRDGYTARDIQIQLTPGGTLNVFTNATRN
jgi:hypothetical protein